MLPYSTDEDSLILRLRKKGLSYATISERLSEFGFKRTPKSVKNRYYRLINKEEDFEELFDDVDMAINGYQKVVTEIDPSFSLHKIRQPLFHEIDTPEDVIRIGISADYHMGSKKEKLEELKDFYAFAHEMGVKYMFIAGDITDGNGYVYRGQLYEIKYIAFDDRVNYAVAQLPYYSDMKQILIMGNHDLSDLQRIGADILKAIARERKDLIYLPTQKAIIDIKSENHRPFRIIMQHGRLGLTKVKGYRLQDYMQNSFDFVSGFDLFVLGHYHQIDVDLDFRGGIGVMPGSFQGITKYLERFKHPPAIGGLVLELRRYKDKTDIIFYYRRYKSDIRNFYVPMNHLDNFFTK